MSDTIVSVRMPYELQKDLRELCEKKRFLDMSEALRSIVRSRWAESTRLGTSRIEAIRDELVLEKHERRRNELTKQIERLSLELKKLGEDFGELK